jgi:hypothetical protein
MATPTKTGTPTRQPTKRGQPTGPSPFVSVCRTAATRYAFLSTGSPLRLSSTL